MTKLEQIGKIFLDLRLVEKQISALYAEKKALQEQAEKVYETLLDETRKGKKILEGSDE